MCNLTNLRKGLESESSHDASGFLRPRPLKLGTSADASPCALGTTCKAGSEGEDAAALTCALSQAPAYPESAQEGVLRAPMPSINMPPALLESSPCTDAASTYVDAAPPAPALNALPHPGPTIELTPRVVSQQSSV